MGYIVAVLEIRQTETFARWFQALRDPQAKARVLVRIRRLSLGKRGEALVVLLAGGGKRTQAQDIRAAIALAQTL
jgi:putative component of toxin-antitoxin plasmid stabilization module